MILPIALALLVFPPMGIYSRVESGPNIVNLEMVGEKTLTLHDGKHRIVVALTVAARPSGWPESLVVGPTSDEFLGASDNYRILTTTEIKVDGCRIDQPWPAILGMSMPTGAVLYTDKGHWGLEIDGPGDGAEDYNVRYSFDERRVLTRELRWGPVYWETTRYDIDIDPDVAPQECGLENSAQ